VHFFDDGIAGEKFDPHHTKLGRFSTPVCFDCDYTAVTRQMVRLGAEFLVAPTFDAAGWSANQHLQHALLFRLRAAEMRRWIACAASSGVSQIIDPHGNVHHSLPPLEEGTVTGRIGRETGETFFVRIGWIFPWLTLVVSIIATLVLAKTEIMRRISMGAQSE